MQYPEPFFVVSFACLVLFFLPCPPSVRWTAFYASQILSGLGLITTVICWNWLSRDAKPRVLVIAFCNGAIAGLLFIFTFTSPEAPPSEMALRRQCQGNMKFIAEGLSQYAIDSIGTLPPSLQTLIEQGLMPTNGRVFVCPSHWRHGDPKVTLNSSYAYLGSSCRAGAPTNTIILIDRFKHPAYKNLPSGWNAVTSAFTVEFITENDPRVKLIPKQ